VKILLLNRFDIYTIAGTVRMVELSEQFVRKGHEVTLAYYPNYERRKHLPLIRTKNPDGVRVVELPSQKTAFFNNLKIIRQLARNSDVIHFQKCFPEIALLALWASWLEKKPVVYDWDDLEIAFVPQWTKSPVIYNLVDKYEKVLPSLVDWTACSTQYVEEMTLTRGGVKERMHMAPVGANLERFKPERRGENLRKKYDLPGPVILYMGQLEEGSYAELLLQAAPAVLAGYPGCRFLVVGGGHRLPELQKLSETLGIHKQVYFTNYVLHEEIPDYVGMADICVACFEDNELTRCKSPLKIAEYLAAGKPIVASDVGDVPLMVGDAGVVVPPGNSEAIAQALLQLLAQPDRMTQMRITARQQAEKTYNWSSLADLFLKAYNTLTENPR